jgi:hypothetical protein
MIDGRRLPKRPCLDHHSMIAHMTITEGATCAAPALVTAQVTYLQADEP